MDFEILKRLIAALEERGVKYAIFGAIAMNLHGLVRATATAVTPRMLYRMKKDTVRLKDRSDAEMLRQQFRLEPE